MKKGWLVINAFIKMSKFGDVYDFFKAAATGRGITLEIKRTDELCAYHDADMRMFGDPDFVIFWDKDVHLAKALEDAGMRVFNRAEAIAVCDSKILTAIKLKGKVAMPRTVFAPKTFDGVGYSERSFIETAAAKLGLPMVIKEAYGSFGWEVYLARTLEEANSIVDKIGAREFLMQEFVKTSGGRDVRVNIVGDRIVSAMYRYNEKDFRSNVTLGGSMRSYVVDDAQAEAALAASAAIGLDFCGVDLLFGKDGEPLVCEVNSNPNFKSSFECTGVNMAEEIISYIEARI